jgi:hypothetical protein
MTDTFNKLAINQFTLIAEQTLKNDNSGIQLPENLADMMFKTMCENMGDPLQKVSVRDIICCEIPLPFLPNVIDYKIGKGCCDEIVKRDCLFVPCSNACVDTKCSKHLKERSGCGDYWSRYAAWEKKEPYCVTIGDKEHKEKSYGTYLHSKKLDSIAVGDELKKWGIELRLDASLFRAPPKPIKKNRGRKAELRVEAVDTDDESETEKSSGQDSDTDTEKTEKKKPTPKPRQKKVVGTSLDGELTKEPMETKAPKKGKFRGNPDKLEDQEVDGVSYKTLGGKFYDKDTLEIVAWTSNDVFTLL